MRYAAVLFGLIAILAFVGCSDDDPVSSVSEEGIAAPAGKLVASATKAGGYRGPLVMKRVYQNLHEAINFPADLDLYLSYTTEDIVFEQMPAPPPAQGKEKVLAELDGFLQAFPDLQTDVHRMFVSGSTLVAEYTMAGTQLGEFSGIPATGNNVQVGILDIAEFDGDKVKSLRKYFDSVTWMMQLGVMPAGDLPSLEPSFELPDPEPTDKAPLAAQTESMSRWNSHDLALWAQMIRPDVDAFYNVLGIPVGRDALIALNEMYPLGFSDIQGEVVRMIDMGDGWVLCEAVFQGTHDGPYLGVLATGSSMVNRVAWISRFDAEGLLTYFHVYFDNMGVLVQIGAVPAP